MDHPSAIGVDLGATKIAAALVTRGGDVLCARQTATLASEGPAAVCDRIAAEIRKHLESAPDEILGVGIGSPGLVDGAAGIVRGAGNLRWTEVHLSKEISQRLNDLPVVIENDANANALGEGYFGSARGCEHYALLTIGSGLGSAVVSHGRIITGAKSMASDLGHYSIDPEHGGTCVCGHRGCAETIASGPGLIAMMQSISKTSESKSTGEIIAAARAGDSAALAAFARVGRVVGEIAAVTAAVIDPEVVVIGGGLGVAVFDLIAPEAAREMSRRLPPAQTVPPLRAATLASPAVGAASLVWSRLQSK